MPLLWPHSWQVRSVILQAFTLAFLAWGHWPPATAEVREGRKPLDQSLYSGGAALPRFSAESAAAEQSTTLVHSCWPLPISLPAGDEVWCVVGDLLHPPSPRALPDSLFNGRWRVDLEVPFLSRVVKNCAGRRPSPPDPIRRDLHRGDGSLYHCPRRGLGPGDALSGVVEGASQVAGACPLLPPGACPRHNGTEVRRKGWVDRAVGPVHSVE